MNAMEETYTDKEFCRMFKIGRTASANWREDGIVSFIKLPNGQIRYRQKHVDELMQNFERLGTLGLALKDLRGAVKGGVVNIGIAKRRDDGSVAQNA